MSENVETIILTGDDGTEIECEFGDRFSWNDLEYVLLIPYQNGQRLEDSVLLMQAVPDEDNPEVEYLVAIEDEEEMNEIFSAYIQHLAQMQHS